MLLELVFISYINKLNKILVIFILLYESYNLLKIIFDQFRRSYTEIFEGINLVEAN